MLVIVFWIRSYWTIDAFDIVLGTWHIEGHSQRGQSWLAAYYDAGDVNVVRARPADSRPPEFNPNPPILKIRYGDGAIALVPYRFLFLAIAVCPIDPWLGWSQRFTLRTLLITTAVVAGVLGWFVWLIGIR